MSAATSFDGSANFDIYPTASIVVAFNRLAIQNDWKKGSAQYKEHRVQLVTDEFGTHFGSNLSALGGWQALCKAVGIEDIPSSITQCKKLLKPIDVNIFDLIDAARSGEPARTFTNTGQLAKYSKKRGKVFSKAAAKQNKLLKFMLRRIIN